LTEPIKIVVIGMGAMGKGLLHQCGITPGMECVAVADLHPEKAIRCAEMVGRPYRLARTVGEAQDAIREGLLAICDDAAVAAACEGAGVLVESSSAIGEAGRYAVIAAETGKHLVMMNAEADLIFGPYLMQLARRHGVVYTSCGGDQHGVIQKLIDEIQLWGFDLVMAGNIKGFLDRYSNPTKIAPEADIRNLDHKMATAYTDGTKLCIEMSLVANAFGLRTTVPGMHGPRLADVRDVLKVFDFESLRSKPCVDYILGADPGGGVFVVGYCDHPYQRDMLAYYKMGRGPFYLFYRPYHLCHIEAMECIVDAVLDRRSLLEPLAGFRTNVFAYAKRDLQDGETLDGIGGYTCYGMIENCDDGAHPGIPIALAENLVLRRDIPRDHAIAMNDVAGLKGRADFELYRQALPSPGIEVFAEATS
jgi:predicted homoserine dehydrogenase-like protein